MNWGQFKDAISQICLTGGVVASWSTTQGVAGSSPFNDNYFLSLISVKILRKTPL